MHLYWSAYPPVLSNILLFFIKTSLFCNSSIICVMYAAVGPKSCFLSYDRNESNNAWLNTISDVNDELAWIESLKCSYSIPTWIYTNFHHSIHLYLMWKTWSYPIFTITPELNIMLFDLIFILPTALFSTVVYYKNTNMWEIIHHFLNFW